MNETTRMTWLRLFLRLLSVGFLAAFIPWITLILLNAPILAPGGSLAPLLRFQPYNTSYESMMAAIYLTWAVMLWRASADPAKHPLFIDFTIWANAAHGLVMLVATPLQKGLVMSAIEALPLLGIAAVLWWLRPRSGGTSRGESSNSLHPAFRALTLPSDGAGASADVRIWRARSSRRTGDGQEVI